MGAAGEAATRGAWSAAGRPMLSRQPPSPPPLPARSGERRLESSFWFAVTSGRPLSGDPLPERSPPPWPISRRRDRSAWAERGLGLRGLGLKLRVNTSPKFGDASPPDGG